MGEVIVALDKFKGSVDAARATEALARGLRRSRPDLVVRGVPIADGGEGTLDALVASGFTLVPVTATGPLGEPVETGYVHRDGVAVIELADVCGLGRLPGGPGPRTAVEASSYGVGEVVAAALDAGHHTVVLGLGGSASTDGGAGMLAALGGRLRDAKGREVPRGGAVLDRIAEVDLGPLHPRLTGPDAVRLVAACDVDNPLLGSQGAAMVYGQQKGATAEQVDLLDRVLTRWAEELEAVTGVRARDLPGAGAAGGVGFAWLAMGAVVRPGIDLVLELAGLRALLPAARLVVTGEGCLDRQTLRGKAPAGVAAAARAIGTPVIAVAGRNLLERSELERAGFAAAFALTDLEPDLTRCIREAEPLLERLGERIAHQLLTRVPVPG